MSFWNQKKKIAFSRTACASLAVNKLEASSIFNRHQLQLDFLLNKDSILICFNEELFLICFNEDSILISLFKWGFTQNAISAKCFFLKMPSPQNAIITSKCYLLKMLYPQNDIITSKCYLLKMLSPQNAIISECSLLGSLCPDGKSNPKIWLNTISISILFQYQIFMPWWRK